MGDLLAYFVKGIQIFAAVCGFALAAIGVFGVLSVICKAIAALAKGKEE